VVDRDLDRAGIAGEHDDEPPDLETSAPDRQLQLVRGAHPAIGGNLVRGQREHAVTETEEHGRVGRTLEACALGAEQLDQFVLDDADEPAGGAAPGCELCDPSYLVHLATACRGELVAP